jgi:GDP-L-fucose synthase
MLALSRIDLYLPEICCSAYKRRLSFGQEEVVLWGTGAPRREFLCSDDRADACVFLMKLNQEAFDSLVASETNLPSINVGSGPDQTIRELAELIAKLVGFEGVLRLDPSKPDGMPRKLLDVSRLESLGWKPKTILRAGLKLAYRDVLKSPAAQTETAHTRCSIASS